MLTGDAGAAYVGRVYSCISMYDALGPREGGRVGGLADGDEMKEEFRVETWEREGEKKARPSSSSGFRVWLVSPGPLAVNLSVFMLNRRV